MNNNEQKQTPTASARIRMAFLVTLAICVVGLFAGDRYWMMAGGLFLLAGVPLIVSYFLFKVVENSGAAAVNLASIRMALYIALGLALVCLLGGYVGWIISGGLFFLVAVPMLITYLFAKAVDSRRVAKEAPATLTPEEREVLQKRGTAKAVAGLIVLGIPSLILFSNPWDNPMAQQIGSLFCWIFMLFSLWPILGGVAELRKAYK